MSGEGEGGGNGYNNFGNNQANRPQAGSVGAAYGFGGYGPGPGIGGNVSGGPVHVNEYAYGASEWQNENNGNNGNYEYGGGMINDINPSAVDYNNGGRLSAYSDANRQRNKSKSSRSRNINDDDAASDAGSDIAPGSPSINNDDIPNDYVDHNRGVSSVGGIYETREQWKSDEQNPQMEKAPNEGLGCLCVLFSIIFLLILGVLSVCTISNIMVIAGVFGAKGTNTWNYGYLSEKIDTGDSSDNKYYIDTYTRPIASDAGDLVLYISLVSLLLIIFGWIILCLRYSDNLGLFVRCVCFRLPQRATIYTIFNTIEMLTRRLVIMYLILGIYGLIEFTYYVTNNCEAGNCYAFIYPSYGWGMLLIITLSVSLFAFTQTRKLDVKITNDTMKLYWPENSTLANSRNCRINLDKVLKSLQNHRKIILNSFVLLFLRSSGLLTFWVMTSQSNSNNFVGLLQPHGWQLNDEFKNSTNDYIQEWINWGNTLRDVYILSIIISIFGFFYSWYVLTNFKINALKWIYVILLFIQWISWVGTCFMYYWTFSDYWQNGGSNDVDTGPEDGVDITYQRWPFFDWGIILLLLNWFYMFQQIHAAIYGMKGSI